MATQGQSRRASDGHCEPGAPGGLPSHRPTGSAGAADSGLFHLSDAPRFEARFAGGKVDGDFPTETGDRMR